MESNPDLFAPHNGSVTSRKAAERVEPHTPSMREKVLTVLMFYPNGLTRPEIAEEAHLSKDTVNPRVYELKKIGHVEEHGERGGCSLIHITPAGLAALNKRAA